MNEHILWIVNNVIYYYYIIISSLTNQGGAQTWQFRSVKQYEYKTDFNLNEWKGFTNSTKQVFVQNNSWLHMQKHKGGTKWFVWTNLHVSRFSKPVKELVVHSEQEFSFSTFAARFKFPILFLLFLLILIDWYS